jgi:phospholipid/cholesterol/gamma-HCH transport system ATP-binding protein
VIKLTDVSKRFGHQVILDGVNFTVQDGETVALLGPSGTGKSVLLKHIIGLIRPDRGTVEVDGKLVGKLKRKELAELRSGIGYVFQNGALFDSMDVFENIRLGLSDEKQFNDPELAETRVLECLRLVNPAGRDQEEVSGPALRRHAQAGRHRAGHRRQAQVPVV